MPKYKLPDGNVNGLDIGGAHFLADADGCITVPNDNYHTLLAPLGCELQPESFTSDSVRPEVSKGEDIQSAPVVEPIDEPASGFNAFAATSDPASSE